MRRLTNLPLLLPCNCDFSLQQIGTASVKGGFIVCTIFISSLCMFYVFGILLLAKKIKNDFHSFYSCVFYGVQVCCFFLILASCFSIFNICIFCIFFLYFFKRKYILIRVNSIFINGHRVVCCFFFFLNFWTAWTMIKKININIKKIGHTNSLILIIYFLLGLIIHLSKFLVLSNSISMNGHFFLFRFFFYFAGLHQGWLLFKRKRKQGWTVRCISTNFFDIIFLSTLVICFQICLLRKFRGVGGKKRLLKTLYFANIFVWVQGCKLSS